MKTAIFDMDGTLVDSVDFHARAWQEAFAHFGYTFAFEEIRNQIGKGGDQLMPAFLSKEDLEKKGGEIEKKRGEIFKSKYLPLVKPFPKVRQLFLRLKSEGWKLALASSAKEDELQTYTDLCGIGDLVEEETSSDSAGRSKPHPDIFLAAMNRLGQPKPEDCVVIGDSPYDAEAARKAGIRPVGVLCGGFPPEKLWEAGHCQIFLDPADILSHSFARPFAIG